MCQNTVSKTNRKRPGIAGGKVLLVSGLRVRHSRPWLLFQTRVPKTVTSKVLPLGCQGSPVCFLPGLDAHLPPASWPLQAVGVMELQLCSDPVFCPGGGLNLVPPSHEQNMGNEMECHFAVR